MKWCWPEVRIFLRVPYKENGSCFSLCPIATHCASLKIPVAARPINSGHCTAGTQSGTIISAQAPMSEKKWHRMSYKYLTEASHQWFQMLILVLGA